MARTKVTDEVKKTRRSWHNMKNRCFDKKQDSYCRYGAKGITPCKRWFVFDNFLQDMGVRPEGKTLDRIDNSKGYYKENCRWATMKEQANNKSTTRLITFKGKTKNLTEWAEELGIHRSAVYQRIKLHGIEKALSMPKLDHNTRGSCRLITFKGKTKNIKQWADYCNISYGALIGRLKRGWELERALK